MPGVMSHSLSLWWRLRTDIIANEIASNRYSPGAIIEMLLKMSGHGDHWLERVLRIWDELFNGTTNNGSVKAVKVISASGKKLKLFVPDDVFSPDDPWSQHFRQVVAAKDNGAQVCELGPGSGITAIEILLGQYPPKQLTLIDLMPLSLSVSELNITLNCWPAITQRLGWHRGMFDEIFSFINGDAVQVLQQLSSQGQRFDTIAGCLPQVPIRDVLQLTNGQNLSHYYDPAKYPDFHHWGLGLLEAVQQQASSALTNSGRFITIYSGRVPEEILGELHRKLQAQSIVLSKAMVPHCPTTSLQYLFGQANSHQLLFLDPVGQQPVKPEDAETRRLAALEKNPTITNCGIYHHILVVENRFSLA